MPSKTGKFVVPGSIVRITFVDFVTFHKMEVRPRGNLNLVVGPNGSGKSSVLCGICLGLAGKPSYIGRASSVSDYIRRGCSRATIEIELYTPTKNITVMREIIPGNTSNWKLNGATSTLKKVEDTISALNIQVDNLCQFLPQDRVADFVKMSPQELLENTEKLAGPPEMWSDHNKLKNGSQLAKDLEVDFRRGKAILDTEEQKYARLNIQVEAYTAREAHMAKVGKLKKKKCWLQYVEAKGKYQERKSVLTDNELKLQEFQRSSDPLKKKAEEAGKDLARVEAEAKKMSTDARQLTTKVNAKTEAIDDLANEMAETRNDWQLKKQIEDDRKKRLAVLKQHMHSLQAEFQSSGHDAEEIVANLHNVTTRLHEEIQETGKLSQEFEQANQEKSQIIRELQSTNGEIQRCTDMKQQRLNTLRQRNRDAYEAYQWLSKNGDKFKRPVHGPMMTCMNVKNPAWSKFLEAQVPFKDMIAFVFEDMEDLNVFLANVRDVHELRVNTVMMPNRSLDAFKPQLSMQQLQRFGFHSYLMDMIEAPEAVMRYLCTQYHIHDVPVGTDQVKDNVQQIMDSTQLRKFYAESSVYSVTVSRYGDRERITRCDEIRQRGILTADESASILQKLQDRVKELSEKLRHADEALDKIKSAESARKELIEKLREEKRALIEKRDAKKHLLLKIKQKEESIKRCELDAVDLEAVGREAKTRLVASVKAKMAHLTEMTKLTQELFNLNVKCAALAMDTVAKRSLKSRLEKEYEETTAGLTTLKDVVAALAQEVQQAKAHSKAMQAIAKRHGELTEDEITGPDTVAGIEDMINDLEAQMDCLAQVDASILDAFKRQAASVEKLRKEVQINEQKLEQHHKLIDEARERWLLPLEDLVQQLNVNFAQFFKTMNCAGEVSLYKGPNIRDYDKYGISIKVKYRDTEQLQELSAHQQSGGERSVATVLYLMAMQELVQVPFRCLDEINQGMDAENERRVFELITKTVCERGSSQYFLVTPKLLPKLRYPDKLNVIVMHKGPELIANDAMRLKKFLSIRKNLSD